MGMMRALCTISLRITTWSSVWKIITLLLYALDDIGGPALKPMMQRSIRLRFSYESYMCSRR